MKKLETMMKFAAEAHKNQTYGSSEPYTVHLDECLAIAKRYTNDEDLLCATYAHDLIEDTDVTREEITAIFGNRIATLAWRCTDEAGSNRAERKEKTLPKIAEDDDAVFVKLVDRIANTSPTRGKKNDMYRKEQPALEAALYKKGVHEALWQEVRSNLGIKENITERAIVNITQSERDDILSRLDHNELERFFQMDKDIQEKAISDAVLFKNKTKHIDWVKKDREAEILVKKMNL